MAVVGCLVPAFLSLNYVYRFAVDVPFSDQWELIPLLARMDAGTLRLPDLYAQHNEHRLLFPRTIMLVLAQFDHWNTRVEAMVGWLFLLVLATVLLADHLRTFGGGVAAWFSFVPAAWMIFTLRQTENLLWGWQLQIFLAALTFTASMVLLCSGNPGPRRTLLAIACAVVSSFSFAAGLAAWPAGVLCILARPVRRTSRLALWTGTAAVLLALYLSGYHRPSHHPNPGFALGHLARSAYFFTAMLGGSLSREADVAVASAAGSALIVIGLVLTVLWRRGSLDLKRVGLALPLAVFALGTAAMTTIGRVGFDLGADGIGLATSSRYTTLTLLGVYGLYRASLLVASERWRHALVGSTLTLTFLGIVLGLEGAYPIGFEVRRDRERMREVLSSWRTQPDTELQRLYLPPLVRERAPTLENLHLSVFRTDR